MSNTPKLKLAAKWVKSGNNAVYQVGSIAFCNLYKTSRTKPVEKGCHTQPTTGLPRVVPCSIKRSTWP